MASQEKKINIEMNLDKDTKITSYSLFALIERYQ